MTFKEFSILKKESIQKEFDSHNKNNKKVWSLEDTATARYNEYLDVGDEVLELN